MVKEFTLVEDIADDTYKLSVYMAGNEKFQYSWQIDEIRVQRYINLEPEFGSYAIERLVHQDVEEALSFWQYIEGLQDVVGEYYKQVSSDALSKRASNLICLFAMDWIWKGLDKRDTDQILAACHEQCKSKLADYCQDEASYNVQDKAQDSESMISINEGSSS